MAVMNRRSTILGQAVPVVAIAETDTWLEDLKLFATGWVGGLVFFGTLLS